MLLAVHLLQPESSDQLFNGSPSQLSRRRNPVVEAGSLRSHQTSTGLRRTARSIIENDHGRCGPLDILVNIFMLHCFSKTTSEVLILDVVLSTVYQSHCYTDAHHSLYMSGQCSLHRIWQIHSYLLEYIHRDL